MKKNNLCNNCYYEKHSSDAHPCNICDGLEADKFKRKKIYVLMVSTNFPSYHSRVGQPTGFEQKILSGKKIHTIRENYELWKKRVDEINDGHAILSLRKWSGKPRKSKQLEIKQLDKVGLQPVKWGFLGFNVDNKNIALERIARNDGLRESDFREWFISSPKELLAMIHFTDFRY